MSIRLLHSADWHIGKPFAHIQGDTAALLREARFDAAAALAELAHDQTVDALLVAGDIFDDEQIASETIWKLFVCLERFSGPCVLLPGNHDPARPGGLWDRLLSHERPANVILATQPQPVDLRDGELVILPAPLVEKMAGHDPTAWMDDYDTPASAYRIGLAHGTVAGFLPAAAELASAIDPSRAAKARLDYLALGDWHGSMRINARTWYSGTPEADSFANRDAGHALVVDLAEPGAVPEVTPVATSRFHWRRDAISFTGEDVDQVQAAIEAKLAEPASREQTLLRLDLDGSLDLAVRVALERAIDKWRARYRYLDIRDDRLTTSASEISLAQFDDAGLLAKVAAALDQQSREGSGEDRQVAALALKLLYTEHERSRSDP